MKGSVPLKPPNKEHQGSIDSCNGELVSSGKRRKMQEYKNVINLLLIKQIRKRALNTLMQDKYCQKKDINPRGERMSMRQCV